MEAIQDLIKKQSEILYPYINNESQDKATMRYNNHKFYQREGFLEGAKWALEHIQQPNLEELKNAYYAGYKECKEGDANCFTGWREWAGNNTTPIQQPENKCYFIPKRGFTSATICDNCGLEKHLHTIGQGVKVSKMEIITSGQSTPIQQPTEKDPIEQFKNDPVNYLLSNALRYLSTEELTVLRDKISRRLPSTEQPASMKAAEIAKELAEWSKKYPRGVTYPMSQKKMDDELISIEEKAKQWLDEQPATKTKI